MARELRQRLPGTADGLPGLPIRQRREVEGIQGRQVNLADPCAGRPAVPDLVGGSAQQDDALRVLPLVLDDERVPGVVVAALHGSVVLLVPVRPLVRHLHELAEARRRAVLP